MALSTLLSKSSNISAGWLPPIALKSLCNNLVFGLTFVWQECKYTGKYLSTLFFMRCVDLENDLWTELES